MKHSAIPAIAAFLLATQVSPVQAQNYVPINPESDLVAELEPLPAESLITKSIGPYVMRADVDNLSELARDTAASFPTCHPIPTLADISGAYDTRRTLMSTSAALKLGLPVLNATMSGNQMVLVQDYSRTSECLATDKTTRMVYGQTIRTVLTIADLEVGADATFAAIAAKATISNKSNSINIQVIGFENPKIVPILAGINGKELKVETYADLAKVQSELMLLSADPTTNQLIRRIGVIANVDDSLKNQVAAAFALQELKKGKDCISAKAAYTQPGAPKTIDDAYMLVMGACSATAPSSQQKKVAEAYLKVL